jgi:glycogen debranching enzyme
MQPVRDAGADTRPHGASDASELGQYFIPATAALQDRRPRVLKHDDTFAVFDHNGDALAGPGSAEGIYYRDTRHLSHLVLTIDDHRPILLSSTLRDDNATLTCDLTNPDLRDEAGHMVLEHDLIHLRRSRFLWRAACFERLSVSNFDESPRRIRIRIAFAADFADLFEVRGTTRIRRGRLQQPELEGPDGVRLVYVGLDDIRRETALRFHPVPDRLGPDHAEFTFDIEPRTTRLVFVEIRCAGAPSPFSPERGFFAALRDARRSQRAASTRATSVDSSHDVFNEMIRRSVSDIRMLTTDTPEGPYPYAGIPWFSTVFGRDALITALETLWLDPALARGVLLHLAANQATHSDAAADAEPGKILHEVRHGEMAELGEVPFRHYYGSVDSTPLFVMLAGAYLERTGDLATIRTLWPHVEAALDWIGGDGDRDGDGFVEYGRRTAEGLINQGWKDSHDSVFHEDGTLARGPIALAEVQAYAYGAWMAAAAMARVLGNQARAAGLEDRSERLRILFDERFWDAGLGTYVIALDGDKRPCRVRSSNAGHALLTGLALEGRVSSVAAALMDGSSFSGWGVRTIPTTEPRYNPMSYHNGSVWPHDNALVAAGLARYGLRKDAGRILSGLFAASTYMELRRLPELFCGFPRQRSRGPTFYPVACAPQAWAAGAPLSLLQSCLGLRFETAERRIVFDRPVLPDFLGAVVLRGLSLGTARLDVALRREGEDVVTSILRRDGDVHVVTMS